MASSMIVLLSIMYGIGWLACTMIRRPMVAKEYPATNHSSPRSMDAYAAFTALWWPLWLVWGLFALVGRMGR